MDVRNTKKMYSNQLFKLSEIKDYYRDLGIHTKLKALHPSPEMQLYKSMKIMAEMT